MISRIRTQLRSSAIVKKLMKINNCELEDQNFLEKVDHAQINNQFHLNRLYAIIKAKSLHGDIDDLLNDLPLLEGIWHFLQGKIHGSLNHLLDEDIEEMIELVQMVISIQRNDADLKAEELDHCRAILNELYRYIEKSDNSKVLNTFLTCLSVMKRENTGTVNEIAYSNLLSKAVTKIKQFMEFFLQYFERDQEKNPSIIESLLRGFLLRQTTLMEGQHYKNDLIPAYKRIIDFLRHQPTDSVWLSFLLRGQYSKIFDNLLLLTTKNFSHFKLSYIFNHLIDTYLRADMSNIIKFEFIIKVFKFIVQRSSSFFTFIATRQLADHQDFLYWFVHSELKIEKAKEIVEVYMANQYAIEFLLVIMIYYIHQFPQRTQDLGGLMRGMNLLDEAKYFLTCETLREYLKIFYTLIGESQEFQEVENRILDHATSINI